MRLAIIGGGVVGTATALGFQRLGHHIQVVDPKPDCLAAQRGLQVSDVGWSGEVGLVFVCVPETAIDEVALFLHKAPLKDDVPVFIRSSVPPGTCRRLEQKYERGFGHNPEFLREAVAEYEFLNPPAVIIGVTAMSLFAGRDLAELYRPLRVPIHHIDATTSELLKLAVNAYLACQISFWNQVKLLADRLEVNSHEVGMLAAHCDDRISVYGSRMHGGAFHDSKCLPKDLRQLLDQCKLHGVDATLLDAVRYIDEKTYAAILDRRRGKLSAGEPR